MKGIVRRKRASMSPFQIVQRRDTLRAEGNPNAFSFDFVYFLSLIWALFCRAHSIASEDKSQKQRMCTKQ